MTFNNCQVSDETGKIYFEPSWGNFDMTIGDSIISVFNGVADKNIFKDQLYVSSQRTFHQNYTSKDVSYQNLFQQIRYNREKHVAIDSLCLLWENLQKEFDEDWLGALEILELVDTDAKNASLANEIRSYLNAQKSKYPKYTKLINDGLKIIDAKLKFE
jgi:phenylalanine-4-hydroxylase